jgi:hypothetical protein
MVKGTNAALRPRERTVANPLGRQSLLGDHPLRAGRLTRATGFATVRRESREKFALSAGIAWRDEP